MKAARKNKIIICTDGSRDPDSRKAGFGPFAERTELECSIRVSDEISVFTKLLAIFWALKWVEREKYKKVIICSDSAAALEALKAGKSNARPDVVMEILRIIHRFDTEHEVTFCWVPGHAGIEGNEKADYLAKESLKKEISIHKPLGRAELKGLIKEGLLKEWERRELGERG